MFGRGSTNDVKGEDSPQKQMQPDQPRRNTVAASSERRIKTLSKITAAACACAIIAVGVGFYSQFNASSRIAVLNEETVDVLVASRDVGIGEKADASMFSIASVPKSLVTSGSLSDSTELIGNVALFTIPSGTQVAASFFAGAGNASSLANALSRGKTAVSVSVDVEDGMSGLIRQGDVVQVLSFVGTSSDGYQSEIIAPKATVIALDSQLDTYSNAYTSITLEVSPDESSAIRAAQENGTVSFVLYSSADAE